jgi:hypothetical protein
VVTRIQIAKPDIVKLFESAPHVLKHADVSRMFDDNREFWRLAKGMTITSFLRFMLEKTELKEIRFDFPQRSISGYVWGEAPLMEQLLGLVEGSFYSHYTALRIHGLTEQVPKTIFLNHEKPESSVMHTTAGPYEQSAIDSAFRSPPRVSKNEVTHGDVRLVLLQSAFQGGKGLEEGSVNFGGSRELKLRYPSIERTLIDIAVRPFYAGGVFEVADAFKRAQGDGVSVNRMSALLQDMMFGYPYHQAIGYYLERAGYRASSVELFARLPMERDFYLANDMGKTTYVPRWRLHVPEGF